MLAMYLLICYWKQPTMAITCSFYKLSTRCCLGNCQKKKKKKKNRALFYLGVALNYYNLLLPAIYYIGSSYDVFVMPTNCCLN